MQRLLCIIFSVLLILSFALHAEAASINTLYVWSAEQPFKIGEIPDTAIQWFSRSNTEHYLYLPSGLDHTKLRVYFTGSATSITVQDKTINNGDITDVFVPGTTITVKCDKRTHKVSVFQSDSVASVYLFTESGSIDYISRNKSRKEAGYWCIQDENANTVYRNSFEYVRLRGNYSFLPEKKSFHIKLNESSRILGMASAKTWLLIPNYQDLSLIRSALTLDLAAAVGMQYTPTYRFADVYVNTHYYGAYLLSEKVQINKNRINIFDLEKATEALNDQELSKYKAMGNKEYRPGTMKYLDIPTNPEDITGGYLLQLEYADRYKDEACGFVTKSGQAVHFQSPENASKEQVTYARNLIQTFENAISAEDGIDPGTGKHFTELADMDSLVCKYLIEEISKNLDANKTSFYLYKYPDSISTKLFFGPAWDHDSAYGRTSNEVYLYTLTYPDGLFAATDPAENYYWFPKLYKHPEFVSEVKRIYAERFRPCLEIILGMKEATADSMPIRPLEAYQDILEASAEANHNRWRRRTFSSTHPFHTGDTFPENIQYLKTFMTERMAYLDSIWLSQEQ